MDTISLGVNQGNEDQFIIWIIIAYLMTIVIFYLLKKSKGKNNPTNTKSDKVQPSKTEKRNDKQNEYIDNKPNKLSQCFTSMQNNTPDRKPIIIAKPPIILTETIQDEKTKPLNPKYIGYSPINIFVQTEPLNYPYVIMPSKLNCVIKFPQKGRTKRKGYKEEEFLQFLQKYFKDTFKIYDDQYVLAKVNKYEPDFSLLNEKDGINIFLDIEIDEPYEGINDISARNATHFQYADINRNNEFKNRGWIVVRFAEIQIHQNPMGCCRFVSDVIKSIYPQFAIPPNLTTIKCVEPIQQWTKEIALYWSKQKYREQYLGIEQFGYISETIGTKITIIQDEDVEKEVIDDKFIIISEKAPKSLPIQNNISIAIQTGKYISFKYEQEKTIVKPSANNGHIMTGYCYVKNNIREFEISKMENIHLKDNYCTLSLSFDKLGINNVANVMNIIIPNHKYVRMEYTRREWNSILVDSYTGKLINNKTEAETCIRTISNIQLDTEGWGENYIHAYCHKREDERTFYFARISLLEILNL